MEKWREKMEGGLWTIDGHVTSQFKGTSSSSPSSPDISSSLARRPPPDPTNRLPFKVEITSHNAENVIAENDSRPTQNKGRNFNDDSRYRKYTHTLPLQRPVSLTTQRVP